jgi:hypothetical protein
MFPIEFEEVVETFRVVPQPAGELGAVLFKRCVGGGGREGGKGQG